MRYFLTCFLCTANLWALGGPHYVETSPQPGAFALVEKGAAAAVRVDASDWPGVLRAAHDLQADVNRVTGVTPAWDSSAPRMVIIGTVGKSPLIDQLARTGKIDVSGIRGKWESFFLQVVDNPLPGVASALVIAGSDKRGTIFGIYDLSEQIGVSPWYWWDDVTLEHAKPPYTFGRASISRVSPASNTAASSSMTKSPISISGSAPNLENTLCPAARPRTSTAHSTPESSRSSCV